MIGSGRASIAPVFWIGFVFPVVWIVGAFMSPTEHAASPVTRGESEPVALPSIRARGGLRKDHRVLLLLAAARNRGGAQERWGSHRKREVAVGPIHPGDFGPRP
jgi:hypothetical protein